MFCPQPTTPPPPPPPTPHPPTPPPHHHHHHHHQPLNPLTPSPIAISRQYTDFSFAIQHFEHVFDNQLRLKGAYELLNPRALKFLYLNKLHIFQCLGKILCFKFQRVPLKFHTIYLTRTMQDTIYIVYTNRIFKSSYAFLNRSGRRNSGITSKGYLRQIRILRIQDICIRDLWKSRKQFNQCGWYVLVPCRGIDRKYGFVTSKEFCKSLRPTILANWHAIRLAGHDEVVERNTICFITYPAQEQVKRCDNVKKILFDSKI